MVPHPHVSHFHIFMCHKALWKGKEKENQNHLKEIFSPHTHTRPRAAGFRGSVDALAGLTPLGMPDDEGGMDANTLKLSLIHI